MAPRSWPAAGEVHLFWYRLDGPRAPRGARTLSAAERRRAARIPSPKRRARFVAGRAGLRAILARYLACLPAELAIADGPLGKPFLPEARALCFSLAHSHDRAVLAVARGRAIGVDLERIRPGVDCGRLMDDLFAPAEALAWRALPAALRLGAFFTAWTRKEAVIKARGDRAALPLSGFEVEIDPRRRPVLRRAAGGGRAVLRLALVPLPAPRGFVATLATHGPARVRVGRPV